MTHLPPSVKLKVFIAACIAWLCAGAWLVGCVALDAPLRLGCSAGLVLAVLSCAVAFVRHELELDLIRGRAHNGRAVRTNSDDDWEKGEA